MNYKYLIINENINSGLLESQVIKPLKSLKMNNVSIINIHKITNKNKNKKHKNLNYINIPIAIPYKLFLYNFLFFLTPLFAFIYALILSFIIDRNTIIISRSYFPSLVALFLSKIKKNNYIFDSRSLFIDENTINGNIKINGFNYNMWRYFEKKILSNAQTVIAVSLDQKKYYNSIDKNIDVALIPCYNTPINYISENKKIKLRNQLSFSLDDIIICYYGSLDNGWNNIDMYSDFFKECISYNYKVLIISQNYDNLIKDERMNTTGITLLNTNNMNNQELIEYLQIADYGVVLMKKAADWKSRLSVKYVDYLTANLQVIVGEFVGEAVRYSNKYFSNISIIYQKRENISDLIKKPSFNNDNVNKLFGYSNLKELLTKNQRYN